MLLRDQIRPADWVSGCASPPFVTARVSTPGTTSLCLYRPGYLPCQHLEFGVRFSSRSVNLLTSWNLDDTTSLMRSNYLCCLFTWNHPHISTEYWFQKTQFNILLLRGSMPVFAHSRLSQWRIFYLVWFLLQTSLSPLCPTLLPEIITRTPQCTQAGLFPWDMLLDDTPLRNSSMLCFWLSLLKYMNLRFLSICRTYKFWLHFSALLLARISSLEPSSRPVMCSTLRYHQVKLNLSTCATHAQ